MLWKCCRHHANKFENLSSGHWTGKGQLSLQSQRNSVQFSQSVVSNSLHPHGLQHARFPYPSPTPGVDQIHVHLVNDAIQPSHPLSSPSLPAFIALTISTFVSKVLSCFLKCCLGWSYLFFQGANNPKERQSQRMFKLLHNCTHLTLYQSNAQNSPS